MRVYLFLFCILCFCCGSDSSSDILLMDAQSGQMDSIMLNYLALGDSYTIGESVDAGERWPVQLVERINELAETPFSKPIIIARTGWRTDELIKAVSDANPSDDFDLVSLLIGVNNQYQHRPLDDYRSEFRELIEISIKKAGGNANHVLVLSIPDYGYTPFGSENRETISEELDIYNEINRSIAAEYEVMYVSITDISRSSDKSLVAGDGLHPSGLQYTLWVERIMEDEKFVSEFLNN